jgi:hypothetical protein
MKNLYQLLVVGNQKAIVGFVVSAILSAVAVFGINGDMTVREALAVSLTGLLTALSVYFKSNK